MICGAGLVLSTRLRFGAGVHIDLYQVDAFSERRFAGNPAAVCPLGGWLDDATLAAIAAENNLSETAFLVRENVGYELRWFTPVCEVELCGHATLASAFVIATVLDPGSDRFTFRTRRSGTLEVERSGDLYTLDFPSRPAVPLTDTTALGEIAGARIVEGWVAVKTMAVLKDEEAVRAATPSMARIADLAGDGLIVTAPGRDVDFVARYFAPHRGVPEDPVTGSAYCSLTPYWSARLGKRRLTARQVSRRGGSLWLEDRGERVGIAGHAALYMVGRISV